jgi:DNA-binding transcriptional regulator LsrR (DeoR family)
LSGDAKNTQNLGPAGARVLFQAIEEVGKSTVTVAIACGATLRAVVEQFIDLARGSDTGPAPTKPLDSLVFYPTTLHADYHLRAIYPTTLVTSLSMVNPFESFTIETYATSLPLGFHDLSAEKRAAYLRKWQVDELVLDKAAEADVFVLGVGTTESEPYEGIVGGLLGNDSWKSQRARFVAELAYTPIDLDGNPAEEVARKVVGVRLDRLRNAARTKGLSVIGIAGGANKATAVEATVRGEYLNVLVTDEQVAEHLLRVFE